MLGQIINYLKFWFGKSKMEKINVALVSDFAYPFLGGA